jgi:site-specific DNA recombinase
MKAAIYSRKSKFTGKGESIDNQIQLCKEYANIQLKDKSISDFIIYEDEGFSGGNTDRPQFQAMMKDAKAKKFDVLICYRLDRISRNVADFSTTLETLQKYDVDFISIKEQFDTSTPMGRAMIYIASVFAQLERETIAERVKDNMHELAKTGRWLGGQTPLGFESQPITYFDPEMNEKSMYKLSPVESELEQVKLMFSKYLEEGSISAVLKHFLANNIKGKNGGEYVAMSINDILRNPAYVQSDENVFKYFEDQEVNIIGEPNGNGILTYNKKTAKDKYNSKEDWIAAVAKHKGVIPANLWLTVQRNLDKNAQKPNPRQGTSKRALLSGILKCDHCGAPMKVTYGKAKKDGSDGAYYYSCTMKANSAKTRCENRNVNGKNIEKMVTENLKNLNKEKIIKELEKYKKELAPATVTAEINSIKSDLELKFKQMRNLTNELRSLDDSESSRITARFVKEDIAALGNEILELEKKQSNLDTKKESDKTNSYNVEFILAALHEFNSTFDSIKEIEKKRMLIETIIEQIRWNGTTLDVSVDLWGTKKK